MGNEGSSPGENKPSQDFIQAIFEPLIKILGSLAPPLAYGGVIIIALLVVVIARGWIENNILWVILSIFVIAVGSYLFLEVGNQKRQRGRRPPLPRVAANDNDHETKKIKFEQIKPEKKKRGEFGEYVTIGRNPESSISLPEKEPRISWDHGIIRFVKGEYIYEHCSDTHTTSIQSREGSSRLARAGRKESIPLKNQDHLILGRYEFIVTFDIAGTRIPTYIPTTN